VLLGTLAAFCVTPVFAQGKDLQQAIDERIAAEPGAAVAVVVRDPVSRVRIDREPDLRFHAASTMKLGVLIELGRRIDAGEIRWNDSLPVHSEFASIVDGSPYRLEAGSDSDSTVYAAIGTKWSVRQLATRMVVRSSNLAANLLVERLDPGRITATIRRLGADSMAVLRGVEDGKAYEKGLNNTTTARDLATLLLAIADGRAASPATCGQLLDILAAQEINDGIPAGLPAGIRIAHKTGNITATWHDAALIYPPDGKPFVLVVLSRGIPKRERGMALQADIARLVYQEVGARR
jgi:beta-lactamase class A